LEHLNVILRIFFGSGVFQNFDVDFWPSLKVEKGRINYLWPLPIKQIFLVKSTSYLAVTKQANVTGRINQLSAQGYQANICQPLIK
jgi:hypothetical protein